MRNNGWSALAVLTASLFALNVHAGPGGTGSGGNDPPVPACTLSQWNSQICDMVVVTQTRLTPFWGVVDYPNPFIGTRQNLGAPAPIEQGRNGSAEPYTSRFDIRDFLGALDRHCPATRCQMTFTYSGGGTYLYFHVSREDDGTFRIERAAFNGDSSGSGTWDTVPAYTVAWWHETRLAREVAPQSPHSFDAWLILPSTNGQLLRTRYPNWIPLP